MRKILIVEDEITILLMLKEILTEQNYAVVTAKNGLEGFKEFKNGQFDLVLTDVMMPEADGFYLAEQVRAMDSNVPIVMLTALSSEEDQIKAYDLGIDDFISKPFSISVLERKINAILRRNQIHRTYEFDDIVVDLDAHMVKKDGEYMILTKKEFAILVYLISNKTNVLNRETIASAVWGPGYYGDLRNIDTHIKNIRKKLGTKRIVTVKGVGYNFIL